MFKEKESYKARLLDAGMSSTQAGLPQAFLKIEAKSESGTQTFFWTGSFKNEKAQEITIKALLAAGFSGADADDLKHGLKMFNTVDFEVQLEEKDGKLSVKWVNTPMKPKEFLGAAPKLAGAFAKFRKDLGVTAKPTNTDPNNKDW